MGSRAGGYMRNGIGIAQARFGKRVVLGVWVVDQTRVKQRKDRPGKEKIGGWRE
jgi:hypothetical protein